jgi:hypothetical protein
MAGSPRVPDGSTPPWEGLKGPATANVGDTKPGPQLPTAGRLMRNPLMGFEQVDPTKHEARFSRTHSGTRKNVADSGSASFAAQEESRGIVPADFASVSANKLNPNVSHGNQNPVRSKSKTTAATADIDKPVPLT